MEIKQEVYILTNKNGLYIVRPPDPTPRWIWQKHLMQNTWKKHHI